jgi:Ca2+/Na+ antiporter
MNDTPEAKSADDDGPSPTAVLICAAILGGFALTWWFSREQPDSAWRLAFLLSQVALISVVIWQACDPFADAAQWVGEALHLPGSVRGATLDAVASSMPELFSGIFFVVVAVNSVQSGQQADIVQAGAEGYGSTIATCAGSAVYNMMLIPAFCALVISFTRPRRPTIDIEDEVVSRDGVWFVGCEMLMILFLFQESMHWWMGVVFLGLYAIYIFQLYRDAMFFRRAMAAINGYFSTHGTNHSDDVVITALREQGFRVSPGTMARARQRYSSGGDPADLDEEGEGEGDDETDTAGVFFGYLAIPLNKVSVPLVLGTATLVAATACYFLVEATLGTAAELGVPAFFVAVILAAAASSVPDTFMAIGAAQRGDDSGAVSNAFGSNIFDICICLSIPLFVNSYLTGWQPVSLLQDGKPMVGLTGLRILLVVLTFITLVIMWHNRQLTRKKALVLCGLYLVFIGYAVLGSLGILF